jgi:spore germination protein GerM
MRISRWSLALMLLTVVGSLPAASGADAPSAELSAGAATARVKVFFPRGDAGPDCDRVRARRRTVRAPAVLKGAMRALLRGPTASERTRGYAGWFSRRTAGRLNGVRIGEGVAHIDFRDFRHIIPNASTSCGSALLLAQLDRTALQFPTVDRAVYSFDGSVKRFYHWLQRDPPDTSVVGR